MTSMKQDLENALQVLVDLPLWPAGRAADLAWFAFGNRRTVKGWKNHQKEVGDYALHVQCAWRITFGDSVLTGRDDIFCTPEESDEPTPSNFNWQKGNRFDRIVQQLFFDGVRQFTVQAVDVGNAGRIVIRLEDSYTLEIFPQGSESAEHWRLFKPHTEEPHFVVTGKGLQTT
jgi:hypothetical protein